MQLRGMVETYPFLRAEHTYVHVRGMPLHVFGTAWVMLVSGRQGDDDEL